MTRKVRISVTSQRPASLFLQVAGIDVYAQSTVTPARKDTTIIQREAPKARARRHRDPIIQDSVKKDSIQNHTIQRTSGHRQFVSC